MIVLDGKKTATKTIDFLKSKISLINNKPKLSIILIGDRSDSIVYVNMKKKKCQEVGINIEICHFDNDTDSQTIINCIKKLNLNNDVHGIMVQLPIPLENTQEILDTIAPNKDVDGLTSYSLGKIVSSHNIKLNDFYISSTVYGVIKLIEQYNIDIKGKDIVVIGNSSLVGMPLSIILSKMGGTVDICHKDTTNLERHTIDKDIVFTCCGVKHILKRDMIKEDAIIFDIGINVEIVNNKKRIYGDCDFENVKDKVSMITPVPGGIGPMTIASLLEQTYNSYLKLTKSYDKNERPLGSLFN